MQYSSTCTNRPSIYDYNLQYKFRSVHLCSSIVLYVSRRCICGTSFATMPVATVAAPSDPPSNNESMVKSEKDGEQNVVNNIEINNLMDPPKGDDDESERQSPQSIHRSSTANLMRSRSDARPMNATKRFWKVVTRLLLCQTKSEAFETKQVRVPTREEKGSFVHGLTLASDGSLTRLSNWLLQLKFLSVIGMFLVIYMIIIFLFSMILGLAINVAYAKTGATCCEEYEFAENTFLNNVGVVFELSWTVSDSLRSYRGLVVSP